MTASSNSRSTRSDHLGRYYTAEPIANTLVRHMDLARPRRVLDLGSGCGALTSAAVNAWPSADVITVDADVDVQRTLHRVVQGLSRKAKHSHYPIDALSDDLASLLKRPGTSVDAAICNPPFIAPEWRSGFGAILEEAGFSGCVPVLRDVHASLLFLSQNLRFVKVGATIGIILPDTLVSSSRYASFRRVLLRRYHVRHVMQLPRYSFQRTDALAHIAIIGKQAPLEQKVRLSRVSQNGDVMDSHEVSVDDATRRLDHEFHAVNASPKSQVSAILRVLDVTQELQRGSVSSSRFDEFYGKLLHTTDLIPGHIGKWVHLKSLGVHIARSEDVSNLVVAGPGDIVLARVGRNLASKVIGIRSGYAILSDCLYRLRVSEEMRDKLLRYLHSNEGRTWLASRSYGVGAKHLAKSDLLKLPIGGCILDG